MARLTALYLCTTLACTAELGGSIDEAESGTPTLTTVTEPVTAGSGRVSWTGGLGLNVRAAPSTSSAIVGWLAEGSVVTITCQTTGTWVGSTNVWNYVASRGGYLSDAFLYTGHDGFVPGAPRCGAAAPTPDPGDGADDGGPLYVRGRALTPQQAAWVRYVAREVVPELRGTRSQRIDKAAHVAWWSLKEGVLDLSNALSYSNCHFPPDRHIGPLEVCPSPDNPWQVGVAGVQAAWRSLESVEALASSVHPDRSIRSVLSGAADAAGFAPGTAVGDTVASSTGRLRLSWLLRDAAVGFEAQHPTVQGECFVECSAGWERTCAWCFGSGWDTTAAFAPTQSAARQSIADLRDHFDRLAP